MSIINLLSQSHNSLSYRLTYIIFVYIIFGGWFWIPLSLLFSYFFGVIERKYFNKRIEEIPSDLAVVITGCSTGFGYTLATRLANKGIYVFAGVRKEEDAEKLRKGTNKQDFIHPLDVTKEDQVRSAKITVEEILTDKGLKLWALVNNAGYAVYGPVEVIGINRLKNMFNVNVFGLITITQAFIPLLRKYHCKTPLNSRIINISSVGGLASMANAGQYCSTKFAVEALSDSLRIELKPWNISVSLVEPGAFKTEFQGKAYAELVSDGFSEIDEDILYHYNTLTKITNEASAKKKRPTQDKCVDVIEDSLFDTRPLERYAAGFDSQFILPSIKGFFVHEKIMDY